MSYNLFLDDERFPPQVTWVKLPDVNWRIVRSYKDFVGLIQKEGVPEIISFDHDLADEHYKEEFRARALGESLDYDRLGEKTGYHAAQWLAEYCVDNNIPVPEYYVHTMNVEGAKNIKSALESAKDFMTSNHE